MIAVFKTNVQKKKDAKFLIQELYAYYPLSFINFDLDDCDKILRIDTPDCLPIQIEHIINEHGFICKELE